MGRILNKYLQMQKGVYSGKVSFGYWLPAPKDKFVLMLRLYWPVEPPQPSIIDGSWKPPAVMQVKQ